MDVIYEKAVILLTPTHSTVQYSTYTYTDAGSDSCRLLPGSKCLPIVCRDESGWKFLRNQA